MVIDLDNLAAERELLVGYARRGRRVKHDAERITVIIVGHGSILTAEEGKIVGKIRVLEYYLLVGVSLSQYLAKSLGRACCIAVGAEVPEEDYLIVLLDFVKYG